MLLYTVSQCSVAKEYSVNNIIEIEKRLKVLESEVKIVNQVDPVRFSENNQTLYYLKNKSWRKSIKSVGYKNDAESRAFANVLYGISLQGLGRNKQAIRFYKKVPQTSANYPVSQLNLALAYMHAGQLEKSRILLNKLLADSALNLSSQQTNRLWLTLAYLYYKDELFEQSREAFKAVDTGSVYYTRSLIGVGLASIELNEYAIARQHLLKLYRYKKHDISADESHLLVAFSYESEKNYKKAVSEYKKSIKYYLYRLKEVNSLLTKNRSFKSSVKYHNNMFFVKNTRIDLSGVLPPVFFDNYASLNKLIKLIYDRVGVENTMQKRAKNIKSQYGVIIKSLLRKQLELRKMNLNSYLKQSRYGLAVSTDKMLF
jgi:tetratricopeptide (TPR) repeat protein